MLLEGDITGTGTESVSCGDAGRLHYCGQREEVCASKDIEDNPHLGDEKDADGVASGVRRTKPACPS